METAKGNYNMYPAFSIEKDRIHAGYQDIAKWISLHRTVRIDGYVGVFWKQFQAELGDELRNLGCKVLWYDLSSAMLKKRKISKILKTFIPDNDPLFGTKCTLEIRDFFDSVKLAELIPQDNFDISIAYGCGAGLLNWQGPLAYIDLPKSELQFRARAGSVTNFTWESPGDPKEMYKRFYFIDWPVLNDHKKDILPEIDLFIDSQRPEQPVFIDGFDFREALKKLSVNVFRVRPWFEPGPWGGTWMKEHIEGLDKNSPNYAWSFELIVPENGLLIESSGILLEASFDFLMFQEYQNILGEAADRFQYEFPIRFDFLDTYNGGNLSVQVHPSTAYIKNEFGESFTQDESYYILDAKEGANVNLGFQNDVEPKKFRQALEESFQNNKALDIDRYVQSHESKKHDFFLIPNQTIHGAGKDNLVLEISSTPYIFTFKMYDWLRPDLNGKPRPLNINRAFENLDFRRKGNWVTESLISKPIIIEVGNDWKIVHLPTHPIHFYDVYRYEFDDRVEIETRGRCQVMMIVEGSSALLEMDSGYKARFNYAETFVVPAAAGFYHLVNEGDSRMKIVQAFIK